MNPSVHVRDAEDADLDAMGRLAGDLVRLHHSLDPLRFFSIPDVDKGYARFFRSQRKDPDAVLLAARLEGEDEIVGYAFARKEPRNWNDLLDACAKLHDVFVIPRARRHGVARALLEAITLRMKQLGAPRIVLLTAAPNTAAQALFASMGFRTTMLEMTMELEATPRA